MGRSRLHRIGPALIRRAGLAKWFSYSHSLTLADQKFVIPIREGVGEELLKLEPDFKSQMIDYFGDGLPPVFIDIGANLGQTIVEVFSVRRWGTYFALEPNPDVCAYLEALVNLNELPVQILPWASGLMATPHRFSLKGRGDASATLAPEGRPGVYASEMSRWVATYPLDMLLDMTELPRGLMIKIDVEGFEASVLKGASRVLEEVRPIILCEVLRAYTQTSLEHTHDRMDQLEEILARHRYRIFYIEMQEADPRKIRALREMKSFPRGLWEDNPTGFDYCFVPMEAQIPKSPSFDLVVLG